MFATIRAHAWPRPAMVIGQRRGIALATRAGSREEPACSTGFGDGRIPSRPVAAHASQWCITIAAHGGARPPMPGFSSSLARQSRAMVSSTGACARHAIAAVSHPGGRARHAPAMFFYQGGRARPALIMVFLTAAVRARLSVLLHRSHGSLRERWLCMRHWPVHA